MLSSDTAVPDRRGRRSKGPRVNPPGLNLTSSLSQSVTRSLMAKAGNARSSPRAKAAIKINVACESAGKPDALQTLRDLARQGKRIREAFGVSPACRRFRASYHQLSSHSLCDWMRLCAKTGFALGAKVRQHSRQSRQILPRPFAHQAN